MHILWRMESLLSGDSVNSGRCYVTNAILEERCIYVVRAEML
jgi:hypothetical protein